MPTGVVTHIHIASAHGAELDPRPEATLVTGQGIEGDRHYGREARRNVTLVEGGNVEDACTAIGVSYEPGCTRRNITVSGVSLNELVGREFTVGTARLRGAELCEPCGQMETAVGNGARRVLVHKAGIRAEIVEGGVVRVGDRVDATGVATGQR